VDVIPVSDQASKVGGLRMLSWPGWVWLATYRVGQKKWYLLYNVIHCRRGITILAHPVYWGGLPARRPMPLQTCPTYSNSVDELNRNRHMTSIIGDLAWKRLPRPDSGSENRTAPHETERLHASTASLLAVDTKRDGRLLVNAGYTTRRLM